MKKNKTKEEKSLEQKEIRINVLTAEITFAEAAIVTLKDISTTLSDAMFGNSLLKTPAFIGQYNFQMEYIEKMECYLITMNKNLNEITEEDGSEKEIGDVKDGDTGESPEAQEGED